MWQIQISIDIPKRHPSITVWRPGISGWVNLEGNISRRQNNFHASIKKEDQQGTCLVTFFIRNKKAWEHTRGLDPQRYSQDLREQGTVLYTFERIVTAKGTVAQSCSEQLSQSLLWFKQNKTASEGRREEKQIVTLFQDGRWVTALLSSVLSWKGSWPCRMRWEKGKWLCRSPGPGNSSNILERFLALQPSL